ncbi:YfhD-like protein [Fontibacillus phaseoli]|uniref:YfhD-like protein n=1 Tax=Fontibacillus phaseoli TaxID=1416533 RepID=A0A369BMX2_9BACL|nr:YfhD family protein [Fontibacillus phaseoli]RCX22751.1 YfhD-like protein [Fontibacillus phaseoli]
MSKSYPDRVTKRQFSKTPGMDIGHNKDIEFAEEFADQEDWEALERSERADARQQGQHRL